MGSRFATASASDATRPAAEPVLRGGLSAAPARPRAPSATAAPPARAEPASWAEPPTRLSNPWRPLPLLCKRFGIPVPRVVSDAAALRERQFGGRRRRALRPRHRLEELWRGRRRVPPRQRRRARGAPVARKRRAGRTAARSGRRVFLRFRPRRRGFPGVGASGTGAAAAVAGAPRRSVFRPEIRPATPSGSAEGEEEVRAEKEERKKEIVGRGG